MPTTLYKILTHDLRSPLQGREPLFDGETPFHLPRVELDTSDVECGAGWNACRKPEDAARIAGLWRNGRPARLFEVEPDESLIHRGNKSRFASGVITREVGIEVAVAPLSQAFGPHADYMARGQLAWHRALGRPASRPARVATGLRKALDARGLGDWSLRKFPSVRAAWAAWDAWDARDARDAWDARDASAAWAAWAAWDASAAWDARDAWDARAASAAWAAWDASAAWDALAFAYASRQGWTGRPAGLLTVGVRSAYSNGLGIVLPTGPAELGWAMDFK